MKKKVWERRFLKTLKPLSKDERYSALAYYQELYDDKAESGICEEEILREFGEPERCAYRILLGEENTDSATPPHASYAPKTRQLRTYSVAEIIGLVFVGLILLLPLACVALSLVISFGAVSVSGVAVAIAGGVYAIASPFLFVASGSTVVVAHVGIGVTTIGIGLVLFVAFHYACKWTAIAVRRGFTFIFYRGIK
jgi:uncharacterized membrane protein